MVEYHVFANNKIEELQENSIIYTHILQITFFSDKKEISLSHTVYHGLMLQPSMNSNGSPVSSSSYTQQSSPVFPLHNNISTLPVQRCRSHKQRPISFPILTASREPFPSYSFTNAAISSRRPSIHGPGNEKGKAKGQEARSRSPRPRGGFRPRSIHAWKEKRIQGAAVVSALERKRERGGDRGLLAVDTMTGRRHASPRR